MTFWLVVVFLVVFGLNGVSFANEGNTPRILFDFGPKLYLYNFYGVTAIDDSKVYTVGNNGTICFSEDGGKNWRVQDSGVKSELYDVKFAGGKTGWVVGRFGIILRTDDGGKSWRKLKVPLNVTLLSLSVVDGNHLWAVGEWGTILYSKDGEIWDTQHEKVDKIYRKVFFIDQTHGWIVGEFGTILHTRDGGKSWQAQENPLGTSPLFSVFFKNRQEGWATSMDGHIIKTDNGGERWVEVSSPTEETLLDIKVVGAGGFAFGRDGTFLISNDGGKTWVNSKNRLETLQWLHASFFIGDQKVWIVGGSGTLLYTVDGGQTWKSASKLEILQKNEGRRANK